MLIVAALAASVNIAAAQSAIVVDSQKVLDSMKEYKTATAQLEELTEAYKAGVEAKFESVENLFNDYAARKSSYTTAQAQAKEKEILAKESEATGYQERHFGAEGTIAKRQLELMKPIEEKVREAIAKYAEANNVELVIDATSNMTVLYTTPGADRTAQIISALK